MSGLINAAMAGILLGLAGAAAADERHAPANLMLCPTAAAAMSRTHTGCWVMRGGQRVEVVAIMEGYAQLRLWSTNGAESMIVYVRRSDADRLQAAAAR
jgi:hypothetical protein